ncbi:MAG: NAD(P)-dependent oxidoreductase [Candidatus Omnitrophica bacterium]|nr:NAD(P)-dependent oxidoreductase [Candidatus Omnitrophota bacterium]
MRILVTGATGFIGLSLVKALSRLDHEIFCLIRGTSKTQEVEKLKVKLVIADITDNFFLDKVFAEIKPEVVYHCAAEVTEKNESVLSQINVGGTRNICECCLKYNTERLIYTSSVAVISGNKDVPLTEDLPYVATSPYGRSKIESEKVVLEYRDKGLNVVIIRPCMVYGEDEPHAMDDFFDLIKKRRLPLLKILEADSKLHLVYLENVVQVLLYALTKKEALTGTFMVADKEVLTVKRFLEISYDEMSRSKPPVIPSWIMKPVMLISPVRRIIKAFMKDRAYDISRAVNVLGYKPEFSTEEALRRTIRHWKMKTPVKSDKKPVSMKKRMDPSDCL